MSAKQVTCVRTRALQFVRPMHGGTQSHLMRCSDGGYYIVKFQNNPHGTKSLANELLGAMLAELLGLPVPQPAIVQVDELLIRYTEDAKITFEHGTEPCRPGLCFGSRYPMEGDRVKEGVFDWPFFGGLDQVINFSDFFGMLVFDKWTGNTDRRQVIFAPERTRMPNSPYRGYRALMIDQDYCFNCDKWNFPDWPKAGLFPKHQVYSKIDGFELFAPWIDGLNRTVTLELMEEIAAEIPSEWYGGDSANLQRLLEELDKRRTKIKDLLVETRRALPRVFPAWVARLLSQQSQQLIPLARIADRRLVSPLIYAGTGRKGCKVVHLPPYTD